LKTLLLNLLFAFTINFSFAQKKVVYKAIKQELGAEILKRSDSVLNLEPITVTAEQCSRSAGGKHDFYSEGDYWWPNPADLNGPYIQRDGQTNPDNFLAHRRAMVRFSQIAGLLASAYLIKKDEVYAQHALKHFKAWFIDTATSMNPSLLYAQAIKGKATGRGIGIIDMIQFMEVAQAARIFETSASFSKADIEGIKKWFEQYLSWITTHQYGIDEREAKNNHGTCWVMQVAVFAQLTDNQQLLDYCRNRFKTVLLPTQLKADGSFPLEMARTKPYGYSLFNLDAMTTICHVLSSKSESLWEFTLPDGGNMKKAVEFMVPYVENKAAWQWKQDVMYWNEWPVAQPFLLFGASKFKQKNWLETWKQLEHFPTTEEVIRNLPVRNPLIWF
jgi:hypothetical protein